MILGGKRMWWLPGWLDRILPSFSIEGPADGPKSEPGVRF
jgi:hypothetical protein